MITIELWRNLRSDSWFFVANNAFWYSFSVAIRQTRVEKTEDNSALSPTKSKNFASIIGWTYFFAGKRISRDERWVDER